MLHEALQDSKEVSGLNTRHWDYGVYGKGSIVWTHMLLMCQDIVIMSILIVCTFIVPVCVIKNFD